MSAKKKILLLGGWQESAFVILKTLGQCTEFEFYVADCWENSATRYSKYCRQFFLLPKISDRNNYIEQLLQICKFNEIDCLLPLPQEELILVSMYKKKFAESSTKLLVPDYEVVDTAVDKMKLGVLLNENGIKYPKTYLMEEYDASKLADEMVFPVITKLRRGTGQKDQRISYTKNNFLMHLESVIQKYGKDEIIVQEFIPGYEIDAMFTVGILCDQNGNIKINVPTKKIRSRPYTGGSGICVTAVKNAAVEDICSRTIKALGWWQGICDIEVKYDHRSNSYCIIEINPRPWGSPMMALAKSGIDINFWWIQATLGNPLPDNLGFNEGVFTTDFFNDILLLTDLIKDLFTPKINDAKKVLKTYKRPYFYPGLYAGLNLLADIDIKDPTPFLWKIYRLRKRLFWALLPTNRDRRE